MHATEPTSSRILRTLKEHHGDFISGNSLASGLGLTRTAIWKHVRTLRSLGYEIEAHPRHGYRLLTAPDLLTAEEVLPILRTAWLGRAYHHFRRIGSTNDHALTMATQGAPNGTVVVAEEQTEGRGRLRRPWLSSSHKGIYLTMLLTDPLPIRQAPQTTLVAALALVDALKAQYQLKAAIKWPNDVLVKDAKVAGILTEMQSDQDFARFLVIGIGINVNHTIEDLKGPFRYPATSLAIQLGAPVDRRELFAQYLQCFEGRYDTFLKEGFPSLLQELEAASGTIGRNIEVHRGTVPCKGRALGLTPEGALRLRTEHGKEEIIWVGDVTLVEGE